MEEILASFIEAVSCYFAWLAGEICEEYSPGEDEVEEILQAYLAFRAES